jgi:hypothetical protein
VPPRVTRNFLSPLSGNRGITIKHDFILAELDNAVRYFAAYFGPYPYKSFGAAFHPYNFGQGFPTMLMLPPADVENKHAHAFIAHEVGHHVQTVTGISDRVRSAQQSARSQEEANALQVKMELQADCYAGIWAHHADRTRQLVEAGDINEALGAASAVGDDTIQKRVQGHVNQESFTHGSGAERQEWFRRGYSSGQVADCDTFR